MLRNFTLESMQEEFPPGLSRGARRTLAAAGLTLLPHLVFLSEADLQDLGLKWRDIERLKAVLAQEGLTLAAEGVNPMP